MVFQKRDKLVHSPDAGKANDNSEPLSIESGTQEVKEKDNTKEKLEELIAETKYQIYRFDKVFRHDVNEYRMFEEILEKPCHKAMKKSKNILLFSLFKSNTILNLHVEESHIVNAQSIQEAIAKQMQLGIFPLVLDQIFQGHKSVFLTPSKLFQENIAFDTTSICVYVCSGYKFYSLLSSEFKAYSTTKEIRFVAVKDLSCVRTIITNLRSFILTKKLSLDYICYKIKLSDSTSTAKGSKSKFVIFDFQNPSGKLVEKGEKEEKDLQKSEMFSENFIQPLRIIHSLLANTEKNIHVI